MNKPPPPHPPHPPSLTFKGLRFQFSKGVGGLFRDFLNFLNFFYFRRGIVFDDENSELKFFSLTKDEK